MAAGAGRYAVINAEEKPPFIKSVAEALSKACGMHQFDALQQARRRPYVFDSDCTLEEANRLQILLQQRGVKSLVVPTGYFTAFGPAQLVNNANCLASGFEIERLTAEPFLVQWPDMAMISYGRIEQRQQKVKRQAGGGPESAFSAASVLMLGTPGAGMLGRIVSAYSRPRQSPDLSPGGKAEVYDCLDIFVGYLEDDEFAAHFRIFPSKFYYDYLGDRKQRTSEGNFRLLVEDIVRLSPDLMLPDKTRRFLDGQPHGRPMQGLQLFDEYNRWSIAIGRARAEGTAA